MNGLKVWMIFALLAFPAAAAAQTVHISADPNPESERCQNHHAAFHDNGDVVIVERHGQWQTFRGQPIQNAGIQGRSCEIERVVRLSPDRRVVWEIRPSYEPSEHGFARQDEIHGMVAMPDGGTVISVSDGLLPTHAHSNLLYLEEDGEIRWKLRTKRAPKFSMFEPYVGPGGQLLITFSATNYGYEGGAIQLPGGKLVRLRKHQDISSVARINTEDGEVEWERTGEEVGDMHDHGIVTLSRTTTSGVDSKTRYEIRQLSYGGILVSEATTPWMKREKMRSAVYYDRHVLMTTRKEHAAPNREGVAKRTGNLRVFDMDARLVHTRQVSEGSRLADGTAGAPIRIVSPTNCKKGVSAYRCVTNALNVITLQDWEDEGAWSRLTLPRGGWLENDYIKAKSTPDGLWISVRSFYDSTPDEEPHPESVSALYSPDNARTPIEAESPYERKSKPRKNIKAPELLITL